MEEPPFGARKPEDVPLYRGDMPDPRVEMDRVSPAVEGYFRIPAIWVGDAPDESSISVLNPDVHHARVVTKRLQCGITAAAQRDGLFLFDFSDWPPAPVVVIPGYTKPDPHYPHRLPPEHVTAEEQAETNAVLRAQVMNAHQACLTSSERLVARRGAGMGFPVTAWSTHKALTLDTPPPYHDDTENLHALAHNVLNNKYGIPRTVPLARRSIEIEVVEHSFELLDRLICSGGVRLISLVEAAYMAACRNRDKRFGEALTLGWTVCEQLVSAAWQELLDKAAATGGAERMPRDRRQKLTGRDYTASVMVEMLEIAGQLDRELYRLLEIARKARNRWAHEMRTPKESEVGVCLRAVQALLTRATGVELSLQAGGRGGVPQWPLWMWERAQGRNR